MAKAKKKVSKRKPLKKVSKKAGVSKSAKRKSPVRKAGTKTNANWIWFLNALFFFLFIYAGWLLWSKPWTQGISLIVGLLIVILAIKVIRKK